MDADRLLSDRFIQALSLATRLHNHQLRKGSATPYVAHLLAVSSLVLENGGSEDAAIAALLHDAVEDQGGQVILARIREQFGERVAQIVMACSDTDVLPKPPWRERKEAHLTELAQSSADVLLVVSADKLHNLRSLVMDYRHIGEAVWDRFKGGRVGTLWYYHAALDVLKPRTDLPLVVELEHTLAELEAMLPPAVD